MTDMQPEVSELAVNSLIEALCKAQSISKAQLLGNAPAKCRSLFALGNRVDWHAFLEFMDWADGFYQADWKKVGAEFSDSVNSPRTKQLLQHCTTIKFGYWLASQYLEKSSFEILKQVKFHTGTGSVIQYSVELKPGFAANKPFFLFIAGVLESIPAKLFAVAPASVEVSYSKYGADYLITIPQNITLWKWLKFRLRAVFSIQSLLQELASRHEEINEKNKLLISKNSEFQAMIENSPDGIIVMQYDIIVYVNPRMLQYLKYESSAELIGKSIFDKVIPPETLEYAKRRIAELNQEQRTVSPLMDFETQTKIPGERFLAETTAVPVTFNGARCLAVTFRDLSDRKKLQAHLMTTDRMVALGQLAAGVGHEINNPLCYVMMNLELLTENLKAEKLTKFDRQVTTIQKGLERIKTVVSDLKTVSRGDTDETIKNVDVNGVLESVLSIAQNEIQHRAILKYAPTIVEPILIDETRLAQVLLNVVINAAQSIPVGHADINRINVNTLMTENDQVVIEISDTGCGMSETVQKRIFEPFYTTKPMGSGTGLGLAICQTIVNQFHGTITVESAVGTGSTFRISFPLSQVENIETIGAQSVDEDTGQSSGQIMLIDDDEELLSVIHEVISVKHDCVGLTDARAALDVLKTNDSFDCIVCDLMMPKMSGIEFYKALREVAPHYLNRLIFLTGGSFTKETDEFLKLSEIVYFEKPVDTRILLEEIQKHILIGKSAQPNKKAS